MCCGIKAIEKLESEGIKCKRLEQSAIEGIELPKQEASVCHWSYTFDKLLLWGLTEYDKVVFLDSDMIVLDNIDELFYKSDLSAVQAGHFMRKDWIRLNSGTIVFKPSLETMRHLKESIRPTIEYHASKGESVGDQDVINYCFPEWSQTKELHLPEQYNMFSIWMTEYNKKGYHIRPKIVHFAGNPKPWMGGLKRRIRAIIDCYRYNRYCLNVYIKYLKLL